MADDDIQFDGEARAKFVAAVKASLSRLDGTNAAAVSLMTGLKGDDLGELGGLPE